MQGLAIDERYSQVDGEVAQSASLQVAACERTPTRVSQGVDVTAMRESCESCAIAL